VTSIQRNSIHALRIDFRAIDKIECYINVLIPTETKQVKIEYYINVLIPTENNEVRAKDLLNC